MRRGNFGRGWLAAAWVLPLMAGCAKQEAPSTTNSALQTVRFQTDWFPQAEHGGFYQALAKGYYAAAGLNAVLIAGGPGITPLQALIAGYADMTVSPSDDVIVNVNNGLPLVIVGVYMEKNPQAILVHDEDSIRTFKDLDGRIMMAAPSQDWIAYLRLHYHIDFKLVPLNFGMGEFLADKHFTQMCFVTNEPYYARKNGAHPRTLLIADSGYNPYRCIITTRHYLELHPDAVRGFVAASVGGWRDFMEGDPGPALQLIASRNSQITYDLMRFSIAAMRDQHIVSGQPELGEKIGLMTRSRLEEQARLLAQIGIVPVILPVEKFATFDCLPDDLLPGGRR